MSGELKGMRRMILAANVEEKIEFRVLDDDPGYPGKMIMGAFLGDRLIGRRALVKPPAQVEQQIRLKGKSLINDVRPIFLVAMEQERAGQIVGNLMTTAGPMDFSELPEHQLRIEDLPPMSELGTIVRLKEDRQFPDSLIDECTSIFDKVLEGGAVPKIERVLHHLLKEPVRPVGPMMCIHNKPWRECTTCRQ